MKRKKKLYEPTVNELESELKRVRYQKQYYETVRGAIVVLLAVAALVLLLVMLLPVLRITGTAMSNTLEDGDIVAALRSSTADYGDLVAFSVAGNKTLIKRVIAKAGDRVDMLEDGSVTVNGALLEEPYTINQGRGDCDVELPLVVPEGRYFLMGDNREESLDSRSTAIGCVSQEQIIGRIALRVWPPEKLKVFLTIR